MGTVTSKANWQNWTGDASEELTLKETKKGIFAKSVITSKKKGDFAVKYTIVCDSSWRVRTFTIELVDTEKKLTLESDGLGRWSGDSGVIEKLNGAIDIDISATPFTNTLPIRRLKLKENQTKEILVVYITLPGLNVSTDLQRYTCLIPNKRYRYESVDSDFVQEIEVDRHGLVLMYPGLFKRLQK
jgi:hypothetical protein